MSYIYFISFARFLKSGNTSFGSITITLDKPISISDIRQLEKQLMDEHNEKHAILFFQLLETALEDTKMLLKSFKIENREPFEPVEVQIYQDGNEFGYEYHQDTGFGLIQKVNENWGFKSQAKAEKMATEMLLLNSSVKDAI